MKHLRYSGEMLSIKDNVWRAEIWQESERDFPAVGDLTFDGDKPITIEWDERAKEDVICGSRATIRIVSPGDRTFADLYTVDAGSIRLDIYRNDLLYWSGTIDTEFYEEPYELANDYTVDITFTDFSILERLKCRLEGMPTVGNVLRECLNLTQIKTLYLDTTMISTKLTPTSSAFMRLDDLKVSASNFYDEDGEAMTMGEVLEGVLQPLGLKVMQRAGKIYIFDLNGLYNSSATDIIVWDGDSQTMGTDKVYSDAKITWSTYVQEGNLWKDKCWGFISTPAYLTALDKENGVTKGDATYYTVHSTGWKGTDDPGFTLWTSKKGINAELKNDTLRFFKTVQQLDGSDTEGIAMMYTIRGEKTDGQLFEKHYGRPVAQLAGTSGSIGTVQIVEHKTWIAPINRDGALVICIKMDMLMDVRTNFNEDTGEVYYGKMEESFMNDCKKWANVVYIPVCVKFRPSGSADTYVWDNRDVVTRDIANPVTQLADTYGKWVKVVEDGAIPKVWGWLAYYDVNDRREASAMNDWKTNRPAINPHGEKLLSVLGKMDGGQYIPYPTFGGRGGDIWMEVYDGAWMIADGAKNVATAGKAENMNIWNNVAWTLLKMASLKIENNEQFARDLDTDDVEYHGTLNKAAKDPLELDTICGTSADSVPTARGAYYNATTGKQITELTRAGRTTQAENLLIGTLYSQYAARHTKLNGEAELLDKQLMTFREDNQGEKKMMCVQDCQDIRMETSEATFVELSPDTYKNE